MLANGNVAGAAKRGSDEKKKHDPSIPNPSSTTSTSKAAQTPSSTSNAQAKDTHTVTTARAQRRPWLATPRPIKQLFAHFPLQTLPANTLPSSRHDDTTTLSTSQSSSDGKQKQKRTDAPDSLPVLHIFSTPAAAARDAPSFNPSCLQHQTWLRVHGVRVRAVPSSNHAAPSGVLPFLVLNDAQHQQQQQPPRVVPAGKMWAWAAEQEESSLSEKEKIKSKSGAHQDALRRAREVAYMSLIEHRLRAAWLLALYLTPPNFSSLCQPLYIDPTTSSAPVRAALATNLRAAACSALHALSPSTSSARQHLPLSILPTMLVGESFPSTQDTQRIYTAAQDALNALAELLGSEDWFFGAHRPGRLDVVLFSYTHLLADEGLRGYWKDRAFVDLLRPIAVQNLTRHRDRMLHEIWGDTATVVAPDGL